MILLLHILFFMLLESAETVQGLPTTYIILGLVFTNVISPVVAWYVSRPKDKAVVEKTDADASKTRVEAINLTIDKLMEVTTKFTEAQARYISLKDEFVDLQRDRDDFKVNVQELILLVEILLAGNNEDDPVRRQLDKIKKEFFTIEIHTSQR